MKKKLPPPAPNARGVKFHTGRDLTQPICPVIFILDIPKLVPITTHWTPDDAEGIAYAILKQVELTKRDWRPASAHPALAQSAPIPVLPQP